MGDREQFWQAHVDACRVSGETQKIYCERHGIGPKTFRKWRARLAGAAHVIAAESEPHGGEVKGVTLAMIRLMLRRVAHPNRKRLPAS